MLLSVVPAVLYTPGAGTVAKGNDVNVLRLEMSVKF